VSGIKKLVFGTGGTDRKIRALNLTSPFLSSFASVSTETAIFSPPSTLYTDGSTTVIIVGDLRARVSEYVLSAAGFTLRNCYPAGAPLDCGLNSAPITDLNGDGRPDIISSPVPADFDCDGSYDTIIVTASDGYITAIEIATRTKIWTVYTGAPLDTSPIVADFNNDCDFEILVATKGGALYCISETGGVCSSAGWTSQFLNAGAQIVAPPAVTDVDSCLSGIGDLEKEIIFGNTGGNLYILSQPGSPKYSPPRNLGSFIVSTPAIADINGDGCGEIFVATGDGRIHGFYLVNKGGQLFPEYLTGFPKSTGGPISAGVSPVICDIDGDSAFELIIGNDSSQMRVYDLGPGSAGTVKWIPGAYFCTPDSHACQRRWETAICGHP
jgi:outer membrane protein assembly factor BamB